MARGEDEWSFYVPDASSSLNSLSLIKLELDSRRLE